MGIVTGKCNGKKAEMSLILIIKKLTVWMCCGEGVNLGLPVASKQCLNLCYL